MTTSELPAVYRRLIRRETHASRSIAAVVVALLVAVLLIAALVLGVWMAVDPAFRETTWHWASATSEQIASPAAVIAVGAVLALLGLWALLLGVLPGRRARHGRADERIAVIIDDGALADAVADAVCRRCALRREQVDVSVGRRQTDVRLVPTSGVAVDASAAQSAAEDALEAVGFRGGVSVRISENGVIS